MSVSIEPASLCLENRFDLYLKYVYARYRDLNIDSDWHERLYLEHIRVFNQFFENDGSGKIGKEAFVAAFDSVLDSVKSNGYLPSEEAVPIGRDRVPINGAHRVTACLLYNKPLKVAESPRNGPIFNYQYFRRNGLSDESADVAATEYCRLNPDAFIVFIYPSASGRVAKSEEILSGAGTIFYHKTLDLVPSGQVRLMRELYAGANWLGSWIDNFAGARRKAKWCFNGQSPLRVYVVKSNAPAMMDAKTKIRELYGVGNHSIHSTDTHEECVRISRVVFNSNSVHFLNRAVSKRLGTYEMLITEFKAWLQRNDYDPQFFCIDGSAVLAAYGIRDARDLDFLSYGEAIECDCPGIDNHNAELKYHPVSKDSILFDPQYHFYTGGIKFAALDVIAEMKRTRNEPKDREDCKLIHDLQSGWREPFVSVVWSTVRRMFRRTSIVAALRRSKLRLDVLRYRMFNRRKS